MQCLLLIRTIKFTCQNKETLTVICKPISEISVSLAEVKNKKNQNDGEHAAG